MVTASGTQEKAEQQYNALLERMRHDDVEFQNVKKFIYDKQNELKETVKKMEKIEDEINPGVIDAVSVLVSIIIIIFL